MKKILLPCLFALTASTVGAQTKTEFYDLIKKLATDSTGFENIGSWGVGEPKKYPVAWRADKIEMSDDTSINFYRLGSSNITINGKTFTQKGQPVKWNIMLKGPRMGYSSFSIISTPGSEMNPRYSIDSLFGNRPFASKLIKSCDNSALNGYNYYEVKLPKKDVMYLKVSWLSLNGSTAIRVDGYDSYSRHSAKLACNS